MGIIEAKKQIVIDNYFKTTCDVNTSIKEAFTKGFEVGLTKAVFPKDQYEARLKADLEAMLKEIQTQAEENIENIYEKDVDNILMLSQHNAFADCFEQFNDLIQEKIDALQGEV